MYANLSSADVIDCSPSTFLFGSPSSRFLHGDHCPIASKLHAPRASPLASPRLLSWAAKHVSCPGFVNAVLQDVELPTDHWEALSVYKLCLFEAGRRVVNKVERDGASSVAQQLHFALLALRSARAGCAHGVRRSLAAAASLRPFFDEGLRFCHDYNGLARARGPS